ncbi:kti12, chromatin associated [Thoreauomyces humboldtii]|nr:kti12, chromatin associated [Thoreauomyces humboldtii]
MPLITICGTPGSGKTYRATELKHQLEAYLAETGASTPIQPTIRSSASSVTLNPQVVVLNEETLGIDKLLAYSSPLEEKKARGTLLSAVERHLSRDTITICDSLNYIKGFRYQLFCIARALGTPHCTVHCITPHSDLGPTDSPDYPSDILADLVSRFEEPDAARKWDTPLFTLLRSDPTPLDDVVSAVVTKKAPPPNLSTVSKPLTETNYLHEMDRATAEVVDEVWRAQSLNPGGGKARIQGCGIPVELPGRVVSLPELRRLRRQYANLNKHHTQLDMGKVVEGFVGYLNTNF